MQDTNTEDKKLTSEHYEAFNEALDILYIPSNLGGRVAFMKAWPAAAAYIMGEELLRLDTEGAGDKDKKPELEAQASERRLKLSIIAKTLEEKSVHKGTLQIEYVETLIKELGRDLALLFYAPRFVDKFIPAPLLSEEDDAEEIVVDEELPIEARFHQDQNLVRPIAEMLQPIENISPISAEPEEGEIFLPDGPIRYEDLMRITEAAVLRA